ncbi:D-inositol 3-phosphate glycosyltransferase [Symmachiella macrocystis]|uniref:D-inositol 3-phosphate glycosyltransferase n=2 Tax=Symmachiella macrocystis TaxID=2527985 RepID=A0A5C6B4U2_9PLAN|nr:D-inositol 3-phosphate glycosyltransferase [Symmachiella macrocystis]
MIANAFVANGWDVDVTFAFDGPFVRQLADANFPVHVVPHRNWLRTSGVLRFLHNIYSETQASRAFLSYYRDKRPDLVYVNTLVSFAAARAARQAGIPVIWHIREMFAEENGELRWPAGWMKSVVRSIIQRSAARVIVNSCICRDTVLGADAGNTIILPNAVGRQFLVTRRPSVECRRMFGLPEAGFIIGVPGTIRPVKGHRFLFRSVERLLDDNPMVHIAVTGPTESKFARELIQEVQSGPAGGRVFFLGSVEDMVSFYHTCDLCCIPSESETFGRTAVEALATETPLVATAVGGLKEIVRHEQNGLSVASGDIHALSTSLERLSKDRQLCGRFTRAGRKDAVEKFSEDAYAKVLSKYVELTINESRT